MQAWKQILNLLVKNPKLKTDIVTLLRKWGCINYIPLTKKGNNRQTVWINAYPQLYKFNNK